MPETLSEVVSADKESANCKLECLYAHSAGVEMIPMMLQDSCEFPSCPLCGFGQTVACQDSAIWCL